MYVYMDEYIKNIERFLILFTVNVTVGNGDAQKTSALPDVSLRDSM